MPDSFKTWVMNWLKTEQGRTEIEERSSGNQLSMRNIGQESIRSIPVPLAPLPEQCRIVEKIEALTARSRRAREALDSLPALIDRYRQSILAAAFRGDLTADRRNDRDRAEDGSPTGWAWKTIAEIIDEGPTNGYSPKAAPDGNGTASLRLSATTSGRMILNGSTIKKLIEVIPEDSKFWLRDGDILIQRANSLEYLGATAIYKGEEKSFIYPDLMMRVRIADTSLRTYLWRYMNGRSARRWLRERATGTAGNMPKISGTTLKELPVPVPPPGERAVINRRIDQAFAAIDRLEQVSLENESRLATLDQSILAKAFRGELVPQDPNDEPASVLLERVRAERAAAGAVPQRRRRRA
ncbi:type I restriction enzyme S subunit [Azospirillum brasilense]|nr:type I restriction enzyme S subunit [Azospirillum brasilense]